MEPLPSGKKGKFLWSERGVKGIQGPKKKKKTGRGGRNFSDDIGRGGASKETLKWGRSKVLRQNLSNSLAKIK